MLLPISILSEKNKERTVETKALLDTVRVTAESDLAEF